MKNNKSNKAFALAMLSSVCTFVALLNADKLYVFQGFYMMFGIVTGICWSRFFALNKKTAVATATFHEKIGNSIERVLNKPQLFVFRVTELGFLWMVVASGRNDITILYGLTLVYVEYIIYKKASPSP